MALKLTPDLFGDIEFELAVLKIRILVLKNAASSRVEMRGIAERF